MTTSAPRHTFFETGAVLLISYGTIVLPLPLSTVSGKTFALVCLLTGVMYIKGVPIMSAKQKKPVSIPLQLPVIQRRPVKPVHRITIIKPTAADAPLTRTPHRPPIRRSAALPRAKKKVVI
jgi:hypothetical protein